jgi:hypothetical protein
MTSVLTLLLCSYIVVTSSATSPTAATGYTSRENNDSEINRGIFNVAHSNSGSSSSSSSYLESIKNTNEHATMNMMTPNHLSNNNKTEKRATTRGGAANIIKAGRNLQTTKNLGKGKKSNEVESTCALDVST